MEALSWKHELPKTRLADVRMRFGYEDELDTKIGGHAIWKESSLTWPLLRIELRDENIVHNKPSPHHDFLYFWFDGQFSIPQLKIDDVQKLFMISKSIMIDRLAKQYIVRCHFSGANMATMHFILKILKHKSSYHLFNQKYIDTKYKEFIINASNDNRWTDKFFDYIKRESI